MDIKSIVENKWLIAFGAFVYTLIFILIEYFNGGVIKHHLLARGDLPGFSNWWGLLTVPLLGWISSYLISLRRRHYTSSNQNRGELDNKVIKKFLVALLFGVIISILWKLNFEIILPYLILLPLLISFFKPVHLPEYFLGFVLGMIYSFGGILPIIFGCILVILGFLINKIVQLVKVNVFSKAEN